MYLFQTLTIRLVRYIFHHVYLQLLFYPSLSILPFTLWVQNPLKPSFFQINVLIFLVQKIPKFGWSHRTKKIRSQKYEEQIFMKKLNDWKNSMNGSTFDTSYKLCCYFRLRPYLLTDYTRSNQESTPASKDW